MHAELVARQVPGAAAGHGAGRQRGRGRVGGRRARRAVHDRRRGGARLGRCRRRRDLQQHRHACAAARSRPPRPGRRSSARSRCRSISARSTRRWPWSRDLGVPLQIGFNRRFDPAHASVRDAVASRRGRRRAPRAHHQPRSRAAADRVRQGLGRVVPRHDDPRLRHGPVHHRLARSPRSSPGPRCGSIRRSARPAMSTPRSSCSPTPTVRSRRSTTAARRCTATTSGRGLRLGRHGARATTHCSTPARGAAPPARSATTIPYFFLDRYIPSYIHEWAAFVPYVRDGGDSPVDAGGRRSGAARDRPRRQAVRRGEPVVEITEIG